MSYKASRIKNRSISGSNRHQTGKSQHKIDDCKQLEISGDISKITNVERITLPDQPLSFTHHNFYLSYFRLGLFWGAVVSFTAIFSAGCGVALTRIDAVEQAIARKIAVNPALKKAATPTSLMTSLNVLLIETKANFDSTVELTSDSMDENKTILVLKFDPQIGLTRVINIPLDSRVKIPGFGWGTIADANKHGGTLLVSQMVEQLMNGVAIDRYIRAAPETFQQLTASGKFTLANCDTRVQDCSNPSEQIVRQRDTLETIRQRLNIPAYLNQFETTLTKLEPNLDSNISVAEFIALANFVKKLDRGSISVHLLPGYTPSQTTAQAYSPRDKISEEVPSQSILSELMANKPEAQIPSVQNSSIAVQNTTNSPELGMRVVNYLRSQNYQDVYLVEHIPLKLSQTRIVVPPEQIEKANHLRSVLGFGNLKQTSDDKDQEMTIRIGDDAQHLPLDSYLYN